MRQRLALERALLHDRGCCCWTSLLRGWTMPRHVGLIGRLKELRSGGRIILVATHDLDGGEACSTAPSSFATGGFCASEPDVRGLRKRYQDRLHGGWRPRERVLACRLDVVAGRISPSRSASREMLYTTHFFCAVLRPRLCGVRSSAKRKRARRCGGRHSVDRDRVFGHAGAGPHVRARALRRHAARAAAGAGATAGGLCRQAARHSRAARRDRGR